MVTSDPSDIPSSSHAANAAAAPPQVEKCDALERSSSVQSDKDTYWRRQCGCLRTSEKLKLIIKKFPSPPPPSPTPHSSTFDNSCISYRTQVHQQAPFSADFRPLCGTGLLDEGQTEFIEKRSRMQRVLVDLVQLVQMSVAASALVLYYLIYCYMQLVYYTLKSAMYFHDADGPMKITIGVVTVTSLVVGSNVLLRVEKLIGTFY